MDILNATHIENLLKDLLGQIIKKKAEAFWSFSFVLDTLLLTQLYILILEEALMHPELLSVLLAWGEGCSVPEKPDRGISAVCLAEHRAQFHSSTWTAWLTVGCSAIWLFGFWSVIASFSLVSAGFMHIIVGWWLMRSYLMSLANEITAVFVLFFHSCPPLKVVTTVNTGRMHLLWWTCGSSALLMKTLAGGSV